MQITENQVVAKMAENGHPTNARNPKKIEKKIPGTHLGIGPANGIKPSVPFQNFAKLLTLSEIAVRCGRYVSLLYKNSNLDFFRNSLIIRQLRSGPFALPIYRFSINFVCHIIYIMAGSLLL